MTAQDFFRFELPKMKYPEQKGLVSVIIPIYNAEIYLKETLDSVLNQTFTNWEAILVNDGSTDNTEKIIAEYAKKDLRFVAVHKQNGGTLLARKTGLENSKGEFIANLDHDDTYHPQFLEKMYAKITETNADFVWCKCNYYKTIPYQLCENREENVKMIARSFAFFTWDKLIKRNIYEKVEFPHINVSTGEDAVQLYQIIYFSKTNACIFDNLYNTRINSSISVTRTQNVHSSEKKNVNHILCYAALYQIFFKLAHGRSFFYDIGISIIGNYYLLGKKNRIKYGIDEILQFYPKMKEISMPMDLKICLILADKGFVLPLRIRQKIFYLIH
ncbi:glucosyltransferase [Fibrobacteria bacterium R8-3-H12]